MGDGHVIIIQNDQQVGVSMAGMVQCLKRHASGHRTIANNSNVHSVGSLTTCGYCHSEGGTYRRTGMANAKGIVWAFSTFWKACKSILPANSAHLFSPP